MKIAVLGWGSLIWCPKNLKIKDKNWKEDGPKLPIEFAGISSDKRLTLVIYPKYLNQKDKWVQTQWAEMSVKSIEEAIINLGERERTSCRKIGFIYKQASKFNEEFKNMKKLCKNTIKDDIKISEKDYYFYLEEPETEYKTNYENEIIKRIEIWMEIQKIDGVVWTDLPSNFENKTKDILTKDNIIKYLKNLKDNEKEKAEEYIKNTPSQIQTNLRKEIEKSMGWTIEKNEKENNHNISQNKLIENPPDYPVTPDKLPDWFKDGCYNEKIFNDGRALSIHLNGHRQDIFSALLLFHTHVKFVITLMLTFITALFAIFSIVLRDTQSNDILIRNIEILGGWILVVLFLIALISHFILLRYYDVYISALIQATQVHYWGKVSGFRWFERIIEDLKDKNIDKKKYIDIRRRSLKDSYVYYMAIVWIIGILALLGVIILWVYKPLSG